MVIDGNPLNELSRSEYVTYTMINGRLYDAATMNEVGNRFTGYPTRSVEVRGNSAVDMALWDLLGKAHYWWSDTTSNGPCS